MLQALWARENPKNPIANSDDAVTTTFPLRIAADDLSLRATVALLHISPPRRPKVLSLQ